MLKNKKINLGVIKKVSKALAELNEQVVYVGGATVSLYADDPAADDVRPTKDIDIILHILTYSRLTAIQEELAKKGIHPDPEAEINCRFKYDDVIIDIMSTREVGWAPSNEWFEPGFKNQIPYHIDEETEIKIFPFPYFLATKFAAFKNRGRDPRTSKDFEDIVYVLDNRLEVVNEILGAPEDVHSFLVLELLELQHANMAEAIQAHLSPFSTEDRYRMIQDKIKQIVSER